MKIRRSSGRTRIFIVLAAFVGVLMLVGILMQTKLRALLRGHIEREVAEQAKVVAQVMEKELVSELETMEHIADMMANKEEEMGSLFLMLQSGNKSGSYGVIELDGEVLYGKKISMEHFGNIREAFRGNRGVSYVKGNGMMFAVPVYHNGNVKYVLFKHIDERHLGDTFGMSCYDGKGKVLLATRDEDIVVPFEGWTQEEYFFLCSETMGKCFEEISEKMKISTGAAAFCEEETPQYVFVAEVGEIDFLIVGMIEEEYAAEGIFIIVTLVFWVFGLLLLLMAVGMAFLFNAQEKVKDSEELRRAKEIADSANRAKSDFLANMSHEIRTPINAVMGMNEMIIRECTQEEIREYAWNIQNAGKSLLTLINDILDLSKIEAGKMEIIKERFFLSSVLNGVVNMIQVKASQKKLDFFVQVNESIPDELYGDEIRIRQVMVNILNNAVKYTRKGEVWLKIDKEDADDERIILKFTIQDTGIGIKQEDMGRLFHGFERLDQKTNRDVEGTGLGLAITSRIVDLMEGDIEVESVYKQGSTFTVRLPMLVIRPDAIGNFEEKYHAYVQSLQVYRESFRAPEAEVLVVDDNDMNLFVFENLLKKTEVKITKCTSGENCLDLVCEKKFDVIFLDHMMPGMDGIETMKQMREMEEYASKGAPVIALTANAIVGVREMYIEEGFDDYLSKPIAGDDLEEMLCKYLPKDKIVLSQDFTAENAQEQEQTKAESEPEATSEEEAEEDASGGVQNLINRELGLRYSAESEDMYKEFMKMFCDMMPEKKARVEQCYASEDWENYTIAVHALKSTSLSIGAENLSEQAKALEMAGKGNDIAYIKENHTKVMACYEETVREGRRMIG